MAQPEPSSTPIGGALLADSANRRAEPKDLLMTDGATFESGQGVAAPVGARGVEAAGCAILPGLVDARIRGHGGPARGQVDGWTLEPLLAAPLNGCAAAYGLCADFPLPTRNDLDAAAEVYAEAGRCAEFAPTVADRAVYETTFRFAGP